MTDCPLQEKRVVVTRAIEQAIAIERMLREAGAEPISIPLIEFRPLVDASEAQATFDHLDTFDWIVFTSSNAIRFFFALAGKTRIPKSVRIACVGRQSASTLRDFDNQPDFVPKQFSSLHLAAELKFELGSRILYPSAGQVTSGFEDVLESKGANVTRWPIYQTVASKLNSAQIRILDSGFDAILFASPSAVDCYRDQFPDALARLAQIVVVCIGPTTRRRALDRDIAVDVLPAEPTAEGVVNALAKHFRLRTNGGKHG